MKFNIKLLSLLFLAILLFQCDDNNPNAGSSIRVTENGRNLSNAEVHFFDLITCDLVTSIIADREGIVDLEDVPPGDYKVVAQGINNFFIGDYSQSQLFSGGRTTAELNRLGGVSFSIQEPNEFNSFSAGQAIPIIIEASNQFLCGKVFSYQLTSDNGEVDLRGQLDEDGFIRDEMKLSERRIYDFTLTALLFDQPVSDRPLRVDNTLIPALAVSYETIDCEGVRIDWEKYEGNDFESYEIWTVDLAGTCSDIAPKYVLTDQNQTTYLDTNFPLKNQLCYSVTVRTFNSYSYPNTDQPPVNNPLSLVSPVEAIAPIFYEDKLYFTGQNTVVDDMDILRSVKGYNFTTNQAFQSISNFEPVTLLTGITRVNGDPKIYINQGNKVQILNEALEIENSTIIGGDFPPLVLTDNGFFAYQTINTQNFEIVDATTGNLVGTTPNIDGVQYTKMYALKGGKFAFINDPFDGSNTYVVVVTIDDSGNYLNHETLDLGANLSNRGGVRYIDYDRNILITSNGAVFDLSDGSKLGQLFSDTAFLQNISVDGAYVSFFNPFDTSVSIYDLNTFSKHKEIIVANQTLEVYLADGFANMMVIRDFATGFKRVEID